MITVTTATDEILKVLRTEEPRALYWLKKMFHGERGYSKMQNDLIEKAMRERKDTRSDVFDYISAAGNRWMVFEHCRYHADIHFAHTTPIAFCYYETYGSVGAFIAGHPQYNELHGAKGVLFTDHFFLRFCQRLGVEMRSRWMVQRFLAIIPGILFQATGEKDQYGRMKVDCRFPGSIGRGIIRKDGPLIEIRTFLTDRELSRKQLRDTKTLREIGDRHNFDPEEVKMARMLKTEDLAGAFEYELKQAVDMGADEDEASKAIIIGMYVVRALVDLKYAGPTDFKFWQRHGKVNAQVLIDIVTDWQDEKPADDVLMGLFEQIFKNDGIKNYDVKEFVFHVFKLMRDDMNNNNY